MVKVHLSRLLGERRMSQAELSRLTEIRPNTINDLYHSICNHVSLEHLDLICEALDCDLCDLLTRSPNPIPKTGMNPICDRSRKRK